MEKYLVKEINFLLWLKAKAQKKKQMKDFHSISLNQFKNIFVEQLILFRQKMLFEFHKEKRKFYDF